MKLMTKIAVSSALTLSVLSVNAQVAKSEKQASRAAETRQAVFKLLGANMSPLGAMAKGKIAFDAAAVEKHATRINQLSLMINDHTSLDTSGFDVTTEALDKVWQDRVGFKKAIEKLTKNSAQLITISASGNEAAIKKAISGVGKSCGGCHDNFKMD
ncbi:cytochrome c [Thalassotalea sp. PP2-459]|uniref:c-type cytochrome n=1 Tax=Thalassotalea sp. PP2-459 TaxID=1742724 RepID=UPI000942FC79|nr:cytochrome c [Thalassotalea sp. PP2-459]OKY26595.1 cytochrome C [Thalassotalea sp. PP2-459]